VEEEKRGGMTTEWETVRREKKKIIKSVQQSEIRRSAYPNLNDIDYSRTWNP